MGTPLAQLEASARDAITQLKARKAIRSTKADWRLVAAAQAMRCNQFEDEFDAAAAMGKAISQRREVLHWVDKLNELSREQAPAADSSSNSGESSNSAGAIRQDLFVQPAWIEEHTPGISDLSVAPMVISPGKRHGNRVLSAVSTTPHPRVVAPDEHDSGLHTATSRGRA